MCKKISDIHSHLVPGVDDGARDEAMSRELLAQAAREGIGLMIVTPHNYPGCSEKKVLQMKEQFGTLQRIADESCPGMELYLGNEVFYRESIVEDLRKGRALTLAGTSYVLVEFHPDMRYSGVQQGIRRLLEAGYFPVVAHVERIACLDRQEERILELREQGAYLQVNSRTLCGGLLDRRSAFWQKRIRYISFLGSDAHHPEHRPVRMRAATERLRHRMTTEGYRKLAETNVLTLLRNLPLS